MFVSASPLRSSHVSVLPDRDSRVGVGVLRWWPPGWPATCRRRPEQLSHFIRRVARRRRNGYCLRGRFIRSARQRSWRRDHRCERRLQPPTRHAEHWAGAPRRIERQLPRARDRNHDQRPRQRANGAHPQRGPRGGRLVERRSHLAGVASHRAARGLGGGERAAHGRRGPVSISGAPR